MTILLGQFSLSSEKCSTRLVGPDARPNLVKNSVQVSDPTFFCEKYRKLYFDPKLEKNRFEQRLLKIAVLFFQKSALFSQYQTLL